MRFARIAFLLASGTSMFAFAQTTQLAADPVPEVSPDDVRRSGELNLEGWSRWKEQRFADAAEIFQQAVEINPRNAEAWNGLGWARLNSGDQDQAELAFNKCIELAPSHPAALNGLGQLALIRGKPDEAERNFLKCANTAPAAWWGLARLYLAQEKFEDAEKWAQKILDSHQAYGQEELVKRMVEQAKAKHLDEDMKAQLAPLLGSPTAQDVNRAFQLWQKGQRDEAQQILDKALDEHPDDPIVLNGVGWFRFNGGDVPGAEQMFDRCLEVSPADIGAMNGKANCLKRRGQVDDAIALWRQMLDKYPSAGAMGWALAQTYMERNEFDKALPIWETLAKEQPQNKAVQEGLARAREGAKR